jgi:hypothetical protein
MKSTSRLRFRKQVDFKTNLDLELTREELDGFFGVKFVPGPNRAIWQVRWRDVYCRLGSKGYVGVYFNDDRQKDDFISLFVHKGKYLRNEPPHWLEVRSRSLGNVGPQPYDAIVYPHYRGVPLKPIIFRRSRSLSGDSGS